jgi:hypothetical protein
MTRRKGEITQAQMGIVRTRRPMSGRGLGQGGIPSHRVAAVTLALSGRFLGRPQRRQPDRATLVPFPEPITVTCYPYPPFSPTVLPVVGLTR